MRGEYAYYIYYYSNIILNAQIERQGRRHRRDIVPRYNYRTQIQF